MIAPSTLRDALQLAKLALALPFDMAREQYAKSVRAGLLSRVEVLMLGPWAR